MVLPFSSMNYDKASVQNLTFVNDLFNTIDGGAISLDAETNVVTYRTAPPKIYGSYYLASDTNVTNNSSSTYYRVGGNSSFTELVASGVSLSNNGGHRITVLVAGTYKIEGTIVAHIQDSQGSYPWEGRIVRKRSGSPDTEIAHTHTRFSDYDPDGITDSALTWIHSMDVQAMVPLNQNDTIQLELRQGGGQRVVYQGNSDGSDCRINLFKVN